MAMTYIQPGHTLTVTAPAGGVLSGQGVLIRTLFGIAQYDAIEGVVEIGKTTALQIDVRVGIAVSAATNPSASVRIKLGANTPAGT